MDWSVVVKGSILTFSGLVSLLKHCWVFVVVATLLCALVGTGVTVTGSEVTYRAQSSMVLDDLSGEFTPDELIALVYPIAVSEAADASEGAVVSVEGPDKTRVIWIYELWFLSQQVSAMILASRQSMMQLPILLQVLKRC